MKYPIEKPEVVEKHPRLRELREHCDEIVEVCMTYLVLGTLIAIPVFGTMALFNMIINEILKY